MISKAEVVKLAVSKRIMDELENKDMTIFELADEMGVKPTLVRKVTGCQDYKFETLLQILEHLNIGLEIK